MEIPQIKSQLSLYNVLQHYNLTADRNNRLTCPWHDDKTPSLQIYPDTSTWTCFSTNCTAGSGDVIDFIMLIEKCTKHEAILKAKQLIGATLLESTTKRTAMKTDYNKLFTQFKKNFKAGRAVEYLEERNLNRKLIEVGYNASAWPHLKHCLVFPLRDAHGEIVSFYGRSIYDDKDSKHFYLKNRQGLYPKYPPPETKTLILTESIIDAATLEILLRDEKAPSDLIKGGYATLSLYGTKGLTAEHQEAIRNLHQVEEVIMFFDGDEAGRKAIEKWTPVLRELQPGAKDSSGFRRISYINTPEGEDVNSLAQSHEATIFYHLLAERSEYKGGETDFLFSTENLSDYGGSIEKEKHPTKTASQLKTDSSKLNSSNPKNLHYKGSTADYYIKGGLKNALDSLKISIQILHQGQDYRTKIDLYEYKQVSAVARVAANKLDLSESQIEKDLSVLTALLEQYREVQIKEDRPNTEKTKVKIPEIIAQKCIEFLRKPNLLNQINDLIGKAGIIGEEKNRIFLFVIASSHKMEDTLHALVQGSSGSGKTHLIVKISEHMPAENVITLTRITDSSLYNYGEYELCGKIIVLEDLDGLKEDAFLAWRELLSREILSSSTSVKDDNGNIRSQIRIVRGPITTLSATTKGEIYEDNMSRVFLIAVDESREQTDLIIQHQNQLATGAIKKTEQKKIKAFLQNCMRLLKPYEVVNPYADKIALPREAHKIRRLNELFQAFVRQVTLIHQYQRSKDRQGRLITDKQDLKDAIEIMFESIVLKVDELDGSLRQFFEDLKGYLKSKDQEFMQREIRQYLRMSRSQIKRYINDLIELEYVRIKGGSPNCGYTYRISYWDSIEKLRKRIQDDLNDQLDRL